MDVTIILILAGVLAAGLGVLVLRLGKRLAIFLLAVGGLVVAGTVALSMLAQADATRQVAEVARVQAMTNAGLSAAMALTAFLLALIVALALGVGGAIFAHRWWRERQKRERWREVLEAAQLYGTLDGSRRPARQTLPHYSAPALGMIVLPAADQQCPTPGISLDDLARALRAPQGRDPLADFLPPDDGEGWEVVQ